MAWRQRAATVAAIVVAILVGPAAGCAGESDPVASPRVTDVAPVITTAPATTRPAVTATTESATVAPSTVPPSTVSPTTSPPGTVTSTTGVVPEGFERVAAQATLADGTVCELCLWVAATPEQRARGLMGVTDLASGDGMVFLFGGPTSGQFWMGGTPMPLSIAFFTEDGDFVSATDMAPCVDGPADQCPRYAATGPYATAVEVPAGRLEELGIGAGTTLVVLDRPCDTPSS